MRLSQRRDHLPPALSWAARIPLEVPVFFIATCLSFLYHGRALCTFFVKDDFVWVDFAARFTSDPAAIFNFTVSEFFRPLSHLYFFFLHAVAGLAATPYHVASLALHGLCAALLARLTLLLGQSRSAALCCGALFALVPVYKEAVIWISAATELLNALLMLLCLVAWCRFLLARGSRAPRACRTISPSHRGRRGTPLARREEGGSSDVSNRRATQPAGMDRRTSAGVVFRQALGYSLVLLLFVLAQGTKESSVVLLPLMLLLQVALWRAGRACAPSGWLLLPFLVLLAAYLWLQISHQHTGYLVRRGIYLPGWHIPSLLGLSFLEILLDTWPALAAAGVVGLLHWSEARRRSSRLLFPLLVLLAAFVTVMLPFTLFRGTLLASRYYYLASMVFALGGALALRAACSPRRRRLLLVLVLLSLLGMAANGYLDTRGFLARHVDLSLRTGRFVRATPRLPCPDHPLMIFNSPLQDEPLGSALRLFHPCHRGLARAVDLADLPSHSPDQQIWIWEDATGSLARHRRGPEP